MDNRNMLQLCRLCLVKDDVNIPIFEEHGDIRQIFLKITSCLPVKVSRDDKLPKKICDGCSYKLETLYEFWNTSVNAEKQLLAWLGEAGMNSEMADGTITAVAQQIKPTDTFVKQETVDPPDVHSEDHDQKDYVFQQKFESASAGPSATVTSNEEEEPPPKRARRTAAVKAAIAMDRDSDDDDDSGEPITKVEDESEESDGEDHTFADAPSTSADDQPGPSGVGKDGVDAPYGVELIIKSETNDSSDYSDQADPDYSDQTDHAYSDQSDHDYSDQANHDPSDQADHDVLKGFKRNTKSEYECKKCHKFFKTIPVAKRHLHVHEPPKQGYECTICSKVIRTKAALLSHKRDHLNDGRYKVDHDVLEGFKRNSKSEYECETCHKFLKTISTAKRHMRVHVHSTQGYDCSICCKKFLTRAAFLSHKRMSHWDHLPGDKYSCVFCGKQYTTGEALKRHRQRTHSFGEDVSVICDICGKTLANKETLKFHKRIHTGYKPFSCDVCSKSFTTKVNLKQHTRVHTGERPYKCQYCERGFTQKTPLTVHERIHTGETPYTCIICHRGFASNGIMKMHMKTCEGVPE